MGGLATILGIVTGGLALADRLHAAETPAATVPKVYKPFDLTGEKATVEIAQTTAAGRCFSQSDYVDRPDAWRCSNDNGLLDPCFSSPNIVAPPKFVLCARDGPGKPVVKLPLVQPLHDHTADPRSDPEIVAKSTPWYLVLGRGATCRRVTAVQFASLTPQVRYPCTDGSQAVGDINRSDKLWTVLIAKEGSSTETPAPLREAWF